MPVWVLRGSTKILWLFGGFPLGIWLLGKTWQSWGDLEPEVVRGRGWKIIPRAAKEFQLGFQLHYIVRHLFLHSFYLVSLLEGWWELAEGLLFLGPAPKIRWMEDNTGLWWKCAGWVSQSYEPLTFGGHENNCNWPKIVYIFMYGWDFLYCRGRQNIAKGTKDPRVESFCQTKARSKLNAFVNVQGVFRCASISWFQAVSEWVIDVFFTASASSGLSELFPLILSF